VKPQYQGKTHPHYVKIPHEDGMAFTSAYYDLRNLKAGKTLIVAFDGGRVRQTLLPTSLQRVRSRVARHLPAGVWRLLFKGLARMRG
jgi:hypothetical protein